LIAEAKETRVVLRLTCRDRPGLVANVATLLFRLGANIVHADQHMDPEEQTFFQRVEFTLPGDLGEVARAELREQIAQACTGWQMAFRLRFQDELRRVAVLVSKRGHCALDLLERHRARELPCELVFVLSNHPDLGLEVERRGYRFVHEPIDRDKLAQEARVRAHLDAEGIELVVLARYMQILSPGFVDAFPQRIVNIHHSFLPAFAGADPYRQAYRRGVKLVGATSHYVTETLDEGPIIAQDVTRASHRDSVADLERKGRDLERIVLAHAVRCHLEDRVIAYGNKTVVFD
jgi:formyltetrahydrofolate deformylase